MGSLLDNSLQIISKSSKCSLFVRLWPAKSTPKGVVYMIHDLGAHCLLYDRVAQSYHAAGYAVAANDHHGHGLSTGTRFHTSTYQTYIADILQCVEEVRLQNQETETLILYGHGSGALLAALIAAQHPHLVTSLVLHAPLLKFKQEQSKSVNLCWYLSYLVPYAFSPFSGILPSQLIADEKQCRKYAQDPWVWAEGPRMSTVHALLCAQQNLEGMEGALKTCPVLLQSGDQDPLVNDESLDMWKKRCPETVTVRRYEEAKHYLHHDTAEISNQVLRDMMSFCDKISEKDDNMSS